jgi:hypothetical protein
MPYGVLYGIPFGSLVPVGFENLRVAGRCLAAEHSAQASARMSLAGLAMLDAAGMAAAMGTPQVAALQASLREEGAILHAA